MYSRAFAVVILTVGTYVVYVCAQYYRIEDNTAIEIINKCNVDNKKIIVFSQFTSLLDKKVKYIENYFKLERLETENGRTTKIEGLPFGDLIKFIFTDGSNVSIRPSGTEPKCKFYIEVVDSSLKKAEETCDKIYKEIIEKLNISK